LFHKPKANFLKARVKKDPLLKAQKSRAATRAILLKSYHKRNKEVKLKVQMLHER
jgi:hypothetical protein